MRGLYAIATGIIALTACAREGSPAPRYAGLGGVVEPRSEERDTWDALFGQAGDPAVALQVPAAAAPSGVDPSSFTPMSSAAIPPGDACLAELGRLGVTYRALGSVKGVQTPVEVSGGIGPIAMRAGAGRAFVCDCRFAVALAWSAPRLAELGVTRFTFSGAYVDRLTRAGRPSLHARGLAIDVHVMTVLGQELAVKDRFVRGMTDECAADAPALNRVHCGLRRLGLYKELLTPDYDADHHDHFHLAVAPLPGSAPEAPPAVAERPAARRVDGKHAKARAAGGRVDPAAHPAHAEPIGRASNEAATAPIALPPEREPAAGARARREARAADAKHAAPGAKRAARTAKRSAPAPKHAVPAAKDATPAAEDGAPAAKHAAPPADGAPAAKHATAAAKDTAPATKDATPVITHARTAAKPPKAPPAAPGKPSARARRPRR